MKYSVASSWFSSLHLYNDAWTNIQQICPLSCDANLKKNTGLARCKTGLKSQQYLYAVNMRASFLVHPDYRNLDLQFNLTCYAQKLVKFTNNFKCNIKSVEFIERLKLLNNIKKHVYEN